ncbi:odorant-binding protein 6 isoform X1 [Acyrthosiphon pisum]|uniref:OBP47-like domain-containing protein n=3 Tax=Acyrthosiphon pisum TaxID=7029 RepID=A0A8R2F7G3_ACYPI|nr:odorant-binding protein 6 isoform X1 [Acyrthosiphon pisum]|eukprot:XP_008181869.1 PREDICTED: odorant-binding protein 6 isoform X1 [Acyrthosiphon pisum]
MQKVVFICIFAIICQTVFTAGYDRTWILRQKRGTNDDECRTLLPSSEKKLPSCCQMPNILPNLDSTWEKCFETFKQFKDKPETKEYKEMAHGKEPPCLFQCIFMQSGLTTSDGKLNEDAITKKMSEGINNDEKWKSIWQNSLNKCFDDVKQEDKKQILIMNTPAGRLMKCFLRDMYMSCPKNVWVESSECLNMKDLVQKCPEMPPPVFKSPPKLI